jgi:hypothetical protein
LPSLCLAVLSSAPPARQADPFERIIRVRDEPATPRSHRATGATRLDILATEDSLRWRQISLLRKRGNQDMSGLEIHDMAGPAA